MTICIIPARGGSKRIPDKNIRDFFGQPMISWSIRAAQEAGCFERIVVSTDDRTIAKVAEAAGAEVPFFRDATLADDFTPTRPVIADAAEQLKLSDDTAICCIYATAPFVRGVDLLSGLELLTMQNARYVVSVTTFPFPIQRAMLRNERGAIEMMDSQHMGTRSQDLDEAWHDAGQFYWANTSVWKDSNNGIFAPGAFGMALPRHRVQDIDTEEDWVMAELMMSTLMTSSNGSPKDEKPDVLDKPK